MLSHAAPALISSHLITYKDATHVKMPANGLSTLPLLSAARTLPDRIACCLQMHTQVQQAAESSILVPIESSLTDADSAAVSAESAGPPDSRGSSGAGRGTALLGSALLARADELVQKCSETKASIKQMRTR